MKNQPISPQDQKRNEEYNEFKKNKEIGQYCEYMNGVTGEDKEYEGSIWLTDNNGLLYPLTLTIKQQKN